MKISTQYNTYPTLNTRTNTQNTIGTASPKLNAAGTPFTGQTNYKDSCSFTGKINDMLKSPRLAGQTTLDFYKRRKWFAGFLSTPENYQKDVARRIEANEDVIKKQSFYLINTFIREPKKKALVATGRVTRQELKEFEGDRKGFYKINALIKEADKDPSFTEAARIELKKMIRNPESFKKFYQSEHTPAYYKNRDLPYNGALTDFHGFFVPLITVGLKELSERAEKNLEKYPGNALACEVYDLFRSAIMERHEDAQEKGDVALYQKNIPGGFKAFVLGERSQYPKENLAPVPQGEEAREHQALMRLFLEVTSIPGRSVLEETPENEKMTIAKFFGGGRPSLDESDTDKWDRFI